MTVASARSPTYEARPSSAKVSSIEPGTAGMRRDKTNSASKTAPHTLQKGAQPGQARPSLERPGTSPQPAAATARFAMTPIKWAR